MPSVDPTTFAYQAVTDGRLTIDERGRIWRVATLHRFGKRKSEFRLIPCAPRRAESLDRDGYLQIDVNVNGIRMHAKAHRVVWFHVNGAIPDGLTINHKSASGDKTDNRPDNLELATRSEQIIHSVRILGRKHGLHSLAGESNPNAKLTRDDVVDIRARAANGERSGLIAKVHGISSTYVRSIVLRKNWV